MVRRTIVFGLISIALWGCAPASKPLPTARVVSERVLPPTHTAPVTSAPLAVSLVPAETRAASVTPSAAPATAVKTVLPTNTLAPIASPIPTENSVTNPPTISSFTVDRTELSVGESLTFAWQASGAQILFCNDLPLPIAPEARCSPVAATGTQTLVASQARAFEEELHFGLIAASNPAAPDSEPVAKALLVVKLKCSFCATATYAPPPSATPYPANAASWKTYTNPTHRFVFDYPAFYDLNEYCTVNEIAGTSGEIVQFGSSKSLSVTSANGLALETFVDQVIASWNFEMQHYHRKFDIHLQSEPNGIGVETLVMHHGISYMYFQREDEIFAFFERQNTACMAPEFELFNPNIFRRIVDSFRFMP